MTINFDFSSGREILDLSTDIFREYPPENVIFVQNTNDLLLTVDLPSCQYITTECLETVQSYSIDLCDIKYYKQQPPVLISLTTNADVRFFFGGLVVWKSS